MVGEEDFPSSLDVLIRLEHHHGPDKSPISVRKAAVVAIRSTQPDAGASNIARCCRFLLHPVAGLDCVTAKPVELRNGFNLECVNNHLAIHNLDFLGGEATSIKEIEIEACLFWVVRHLVYQSKKALGVCPKLGAIRVGIDQHRQSAASVILVHDAKGLLDHDEIAALEILGGEQSATTVACRSNLGVLDKRGMVKPDVILVS